MNKEINNNFNALRKVISEFWFLILFFVGFFSVGLYWLLYPQDSTYFYFAIGLELVLILLFYVFSNKGFKRVKKIEDAYKTISIEKDELLESFEDLSKNNALQNEMLGSLELTIHNATIEGIAVVLAQKAVKFFGVHRAEVWLPNSEPRLLSFHSTSEMQNDHPKGLLTDKEWKFLVDYFGNSTEGSVWLFPDVKDFELPEIIRNYFANFPVLRSAAIIPVFRRSELVCVTILGNNLKKKEWPVVGDINWQYWQALINTTLLNELYKTNKAKSELSLRRETSLFQFLNEKIFRFSFDSTLGVEKFPFSPTEYDQISCEANMAGVAFLRMQNLALSWELTDEVITEYGIHALKTTRSWSSEGAREIWGRNWVVQVNWEDHGEVTDIWVVLKDVTSFTEETERCNQLIMGIKASVIVCGVDLKIQYINPQTSKELGLDIAEIQKYKLLALFDEQCHERLFDAKNSVLSNECEEVFLSGMNWVKSGYEQDVDLWLSSHYGQIYITLVSPKERVVKEKQLQEEKYYLEDILKNEPYALSILGENLEVLYETAGMDNYFGYPLDLRFGRFGFEYLDPSIAALLEKEAKVLLKNSKKKSVLQYRSSFLDAQQKEHSVFVTLASFHSNIMKEGRLLMKIEKTEQKEEEKSISVKDDFTILESIFKFLDKAILCIDSDGEIIYYNQAIGAEFGYAETELIGQKIITLIAQEHQGKFFKDLKKVSNNDGKTELVAKFIRKDQKEVICSWTIHNEAGLNKIFVEVAPIENELEADQQKSQTLQFFSQVLNKQETSLLVTGVYGNIKYVNGAVVSIFNQEVSGSFFDLIHPKDKDVVKDVFRALAEGKKQATKRQRIRMLINEDVVAMEFSITYLPSGEYVNESILLEGKIKEQVQGQASLLTQSEWVVNNLDQAVILVDEHFLVQKVNTLAVGIFSGLKVGVNVLQVIKNNSLEKMIKTEVGGLLNNTGYESKKCIFQIGEKHYEISFLNGVHEGDVYGVLMLISETTEFIERIEHQEDMIKYLRANNEAQAKRLNTIRYENDTLEEHFRLDLFERLKLAYKLFLDKEIQEEELGLYELTELVDTFNRLKLDMPVSLKGSFDVDIWLSVKKNEFLLLLASFSFYLKEVLITDGQTFSMNFKAEKKYLVFEVIISNPDEAGVNFFDHSIKAVHQWGKSYAVHPALFTLFYFKDLGLIEALKHEYHEKTLTVSLSFSTNILK